MGSDLSRLMEGNKIFKIKNASLMKDLSENGQSPQVMVIACSDSRVDPALLLNASPGDLFVIRSIANIVPLYQGDTQTSETASALDFGVNFFKVKHLVIMGHSDCAGLQSYLSPQRIEKNPLIQNWLSQLGPNKNKKQTVVACAKSALFKSREHCLSYPWIKEKVENGTLSLHLLFAEVSTGEVFEITEQP